MLNLLKNVFFKEIPSEYINPDYHQNTFPTDYEEEMNADTPLEIRIKNAKLNDRDERVFLLIDMQESFLKNIDKSESDRIIQAQIEVLEYCAKYDHPVIALEYDGHGPTIESLAKKVKKVPQHSFITKSKANGFYTPDYQSNYAN